MSDLVARLRAARESRHGKGSLKLPSVPCLYEEAADRIEEAEGLVARLLVAATKSEIGWMPSDQWALEDATAFLSDSADLNSGGQER